MMSYNIRHGVGEDDRLSLARLSETIQNSKATIIGIQEVDKHHGARSNYEDQAKKLAKRLNMNYVYGANLISPALDDHGINQEYGNAILTPYPIIASKNTHLNSYGEEQRGLLQATIDVNGTQVTVYNTHLELDNTIRMKQIEEIIQIITADPGPKVLLGDFNAEPGSEELQLLKNKTHFSDVFENIKDSFTFPSGKPTIRIDYLFTSPEITYCKQEVIKASGSDHLPIIARVKIDHH